MLTYFPHERVIIFYSWQGMEAVTLGSMLWRGQGFVLPAVIVQIVWLISILILHVVEFHACTYFFLFLWKCNSLCCCDVLCNNKPDGQRLGDEMYAGLMQAQLQIKWTEGWFFPPGGMGCFSWVEFCFARKFCCAVISKGFPCWGFWHGGGWGSSLSLLSISSPGLSSLPSRNRDWGAAVSSGLQVNTCFWFLWLSFQHLLSRINVCAWDG